MLSTSPRHQSYLTFSLISLILLTFLVLQTNSACLSTQYFNTTTNSCQDCAPGCTGCLSLANCTGCDSGLTLKKYAGNNFLCNCSTANQYYNSGSKLCGSCAFAITHCSSCTSTASGNKCTNCDPGYYLNNNIECLTCPFGCATCQSSTKCNTCIPNYAITGGLCYPIPCPKLMTFCVACQYFPLTCTLCDPGYYPSGTSCLPCGPNCVTCDAQTCLTCSPGFAVLSPSCEACEIALFNPGCTSCSNTECFQCVAGTIMDPITTYCDCPNYGESFFNGSCHLCSQLYFSDCIRCNSTTCFDCTDGLFYNMTSKLCEPLINACGDSKWERFEDCDDGNLIDGDGCSSTCKIEADYECLRSQKLASGASFCKYTRDFTISLAYVEKKLSENVAQLFYTIEPSTFQQWTTAELEKFLSPVEIVDKDTGTVKIIPFNSVKFNYLRVGGANQLQLVVDYGESDIQNTYVRFNMNKTATSLPAINLQNPQAKVLVKISSSNNGVDLYNYGSEIYDFQSSVNGLCSAIGFISLFFMIFGMIIPFGKLIVIEALAVVQLSFFSVLELKKIPPTFIGFKNLIYSSGYNDNSIFNTPTGQAGQIVFELMGLGSNVLSNYNIGFVLFFWVPFLLGIVGYIICSKIAKKAKPDSKDLRDSLMETNTNIKVGEDSDSVFIKNLKVAVFERILFECSFYGIIFSGYLAWTSIFQGFRTTSLSNIFLSSLIAVIWTIMAIAFSKTKTGYIDLKEHSTMDRKMLQELNSFLAKGFGDFKEIRNQIAKKEILEQGRSEKIYIFFMLERVLVSAVIVYLSSLFDFSGAAIIVVFLAFLIVMVMSHLKAQKKKPKEQQQSLFCHLYQNYVLRQAINFITIIIVQALIVLQQMTLKSASIVSEVFTVNSTTTKMIPMAILSLVLVNLIFNIFMWVWELRKSQVINKSIQVGKLFFTRTISPKGSGKEEDESAKPFKSPKKRDQSSSKSNEDSAKKLNPEKAQNVEAVSPMKTAKQQENEISQAMSSYLQTTILGQPKNSPFMGFGQTDNRKKLVRIPKLRDVNNSRNYSSQDRSEEGSVVGNVLHEVDA